MDYMGILKRSWAITWRYRALWLLGLFAGVTGPSVGGGSSGGGGGSGGGTGGGTTGGTPSWDPEIGRYLMDALPVLVALGAVIVVVGVVWWIFGIAARGGLVGAVDGIESGGSVTVGSAWSGGFANWGRVFLIELVLGLPAFLLVVAALVLLLVPVFTAIAAGRTPGLEMLGGALGGVGLAILAIPVSILAGTLVIVGTRYAVLADMGSMSAIGAAWGALRSRFKDIAVMWLVNLAVNAALGFVIGIPLAIVAVIFILPAVGFGAILQSWQAAAGTIAIMIGVLALLGMLISSVWGTFTSAIWTVWWRRFTGREVVAESTPAAPVPGPLPPPPPPVPSEGYVIATAPSAPPVEEAPPAEDA